MKSFEYVVVKYVPNVARDESVNVGVLVREPVAGDFSFKFLPRGAVVRKLWPTADMNIVRHLEKQLERTQPSQLSLSPPSLGRTGSPQEPGVFASARGKFAGHHQFSRGRPGATAERFRCS